MSERPSRAVCLAVGLSHTTVGELERVFARRAAVLRPDDALVECLTDETADAARRALDHQLDGRPLVAAVVSVAPATDAARAAVNQRTAIESMREVLLWVRLLNGAMADQEPGGATVLTLPEPHAPADVIAAHGIIGITRSASVSLAAQGVRTHAVDRADGDDATFARLVSALASDDLRWLSGHVLATTVGDVGILTDEEPLWQLFTDATADDAWLARINAFVRTTNVPAWARR
jgi:hypothetical protein